MFNVFSLKKASMLPKRMYESHIFHVQIYMKCINENNYFLQEINTNVTNPNVYMDHC